MLDIIVDKTTLTGVEKVFFHGQYTIVRKWGVSEEIDDEWVTTQLAIIEQEQKDAVADEKKVRMRSRLK